MKSMLLTLWNKLKMDEKLSFVDEDGVEAPITVEAVKALLAKRTALTAENLKGPPETDPRKTGLIRLVVSDT
jgi:hypothetical protein